MTNDLLTRIIDFVFSHQPSSNEDEKLFWDNHWSKMIKYYEEHREIFEINDKWDFHCNEALHQHYKSIVGSFNNIKCIECGSGGGYESSLMTKDGALVTVLDYSQKAIEYAGIVSKRLGVFNRIEFICKDIFDFRTIRKYDFAWNCGVIEHYQDKEIIQIIKKMRSLVKNNDLVIVTIPNLLSPQSIYWMVINGKGSERYLSHKKLVNLMKRSGLKNISIKTLNYWLPSFFPFNWAIKTSKWKFLNQSKFLMWLFSGIGFNND